MLKNHKIKYLGVLKYAESEKHIKRADNEYLKNWEISFIVHCLMMDTADEEANAPRNSFMNVIIIMC